jgi:threonine/homoserine/homoserine lactone efflux protein
MAGAVALVDVLYAGVGLAGANQLLSGSGLRLALGLASGAVLIVIGARTAWRGFMARFGTETQAEIATPSGAFLTALSATALNPLTIALWTVSFPAASSGVAHGLVPDLALLVGITGGTLAWYCGFSVVVALAGKRLGPRLLPVIDIGVGGALVVFGTLLGYRAVADER